MKRFLYIILLFLFVSIPVSAEEGNSYINQAEDFVQQYDIDFNEIKEKGFSYIWDSIKSVSKQKTTATLNVFYKITAILLLTSFINLLAADNQRYIVIIVNTVTVLLIFTYVFESFGQLTGNISDVFFNVKNFITTFIPVLAGMTYASGGMITSTVYTGFFMICIVTVAGICINYIVPSVNIFLAIGVTSSISSVINIKPLCSMYSKTVKLIMTAAVSALCFVLTIQTAITQSQDNFAVKTGRFLIGSAVPIIGSALQGAVSSVYASVGIIKNFFGIAGIVIILNMFLPIVISLSINWIGYCLMITLSEMLENKTSASLLAIFREAIEIYLSLTVLFMILLLFSLTIMIKATQGV